MNDDLNEIVFQNEKHLMLGGRMYEQPPAIPQGKSKIGRNAPCPCGSGKKYKKCCSPRDAEARDAYKAIREDIERLDGWSNGVIDAIEACRHDEAERLCENLLTHYPDQVDGHDRMAILREAQGRWKEAVEAYDRVLLHIERKPDGFDQESIDYFRERRERAQQKATGI